MNKFSGHFLGAALAFATPATALAQSTATQTAPEPQTRVTLNIDVLQRYGATLVATARTTDMQACHIRADQINKLMPWLGGANEFALCIADNGDETGATRPHLGSVGDTEVYGDFVWSSSTLNPPSF